MTDAAPKPAANPRHKWYIVHAYSNFEKKVAQHLTDQARQQGLEDCFSEILVPTEDVVEIRRGRKVKSDRKFFPGYVLVQIETSAEGTVPLIDNESWHLIKETPKVLGFIGGTRERPLPIKDTEADVILQRVQDGVDKPRPKVLFEPGQLVRVVDGPFNDFNGTVEDINYEKSRLRVAVMIFGRSTPVELEFGQVEKA